MSPTSHEVFARRRCDGTVLAEGFQHRYDTSGTSIYPEFTLVFTLFSLVSLIILNGILILILSVRSDNASKQTISHIKLKLTFCVVLYFKVIPLTLQTVLSVLVS